jgi:carboxyl-terminal processing protease
MRIVFALLALPLFGQLDPSQKKLQIDSFEMVWTTIRDKHWEKQPGGLDWQQIHEEYRPRVERARSVDEARQVMSEMLGRLKQTHFGILPATAYRNLEENGAPTGGPGVTGIDLRLLDGHAVVVSVDPGSSAEKSGVKPGWIVRAVQGQELDKIVEDLKALPEITRTRALAQRLTGTHGSSVEAAFVDGTGAQVTRKLEFGDPRGEPSAFGNMPAVAVSVESRRIGNTGYFRLNYFLDLLRVVNAFAALVKECAHCDGLIIDLRGNPGGIGGMAMSLSGFLVDMPGHQLGTMVMRDTTLKFVVNPRLDTFEGPVAVLVDALSASTAEIFAGGLKDLHRARIFGTRTAAAALPSVITRLPNGDGFQYAVANYISEGGKPLEGLGVEPDMEVKLSRDSLLAGHDSVLDAALNWVKKEGAK